MRWLRSTSDAVAAGSGIVFIGTSWGWVASMPRVSFGFNHLVDISFTVPLPSKAATHHANHPAAGIHVMSDPGRSDVFAEERQDHIARIVEEHGRARVADLASTFRVSGVTIRKDLAVLERQGRIVRTHGGAMTVGRSGAERAFDVRERLQRDEKDAIGREAAGMVVDGDSIALDASTTALALARHLKG